MSLSITTAAITAKLVDFGVKVAIQLGWKFNDGPLHRHAEKRRLAMIARELKQKQIEEQGK